MIRRPPRSTQSRSSAASDVYKRQIQRGRPAPAHRHFGSATSRTRTTDATPTHQNPKDRDIPELVNPPLDIEGSQITAYHLSLIHISEPTRLGMISYAVF